MLRALCLSVSLLAACGDPAESPLPAAPVINACEGLAPLTVTAHPAKVRIHEAVSLVATGGSGRYSFALAEGGSGGTLHADRLVAGPTPALDHITARDDCGQQAVVDVDVRAGFVVEPSRATVKPGASFQVHVEGTLGDAVFRPQSLASSGSITPGGLYTAGATEGLDLVAVRDTGSGEEVLLQFKVSAVAQFRASPSVLAVPTGASVTLTTLDGSGVLTWSKRTGPGTLAGSSFTAERDAVGTAVLDATDMYTHEVTTVSVHVLEELTRSDRPHGRLSDVANIATGDFDGDGIEDVALGVPESDLGHPSAGALFVFRGSATGLPSTPTWIVTGDTDTANLGAVLAAGDLDGDGHDDLAASAPGADVTVSDSGAVLLYKFTSQGPSLLRPALTGLGRGNFGASLAIADVDGDGDRDLIIGSPGADLAPSSSVANRGVIDLFLLQAGADIPDLGTVRLGGSDLGVDGSLKPTRDVRFGRGLAVADFNGDGRPDLASLGSVNNSLLAGTAVAKGQIAVAVHLGRAASPALLDTPDLYILPANLADSAEGTFRLSSAPAVSDSKAVRLILTADQMDSPDLSGKAGVKSGGNAGGALLFDLSAQEVRPGAPTKPVQLSRADALAKVWGDEGGIGAGRSVATADVDGDGALELLLGAPYASYNPMPSNAALKLNLSGKILVFPYTKLAKGAELNKPIDTRFGANKSDALGVAVAGFVPATKGQQGVVAFAARASTQYGDFTGRLDSYQGTGSLASFGASSAELTARLASEQHGVAVELSVVDGQVRALVGMPGFSGAGANADGNDVGACRALAYVIGAGAAPRVVAEGAGSPYSDGGQLAYGGRAAGSDVAQTDFDGDGRLDYVVAMPQLPVPNAMSTDYASVQPACVTGISNSNGGALIFLARPDGSYKEGFRVFGIGPIAGCTPADGAPCKRSGLARAGIAGGFDFDGDGKQDLLLTRNNGIEVYLGRAPEDPALGKPSMVCDAAFSLPALAQQTSAPAALGDLDGDGCAEVGARYADGMRSGWLLAFGFSSAGMRCAGHKEGAWLRVSGDAETGLDNMQLGGASTRAGKLLGDARDFVAVSAAQYPFAGVAQPSVLLFDVAQLTAKRPAKGELVLSALNDVLTPYALSYRERTVGLGQSLAGNVDLDGDGQVDLVVSAPGASLNGDGSGAVFAFRGGPQLATAFAARRSLPLDPWLTVVGDGSERGGVGQSLSVVAKTASTKPTLAIGAPLSYRTGTANGTTWLLAL